MGASGGARRGDGMSADVNVRGWWGEDRVNIAVAILLLVAGFLADPFQAFSGSSRVSEDAVNRVLAAIYPAPFAGQVLPSAGAALARDRIALVLLRDADAEYANQGAGFPVPLQVHGDMLRQVLCAEPAAIFIDMNFRWERQKGDAAQFAEQLRYRMRNGACEPLPPGAPELRRTPVLVGFVASASSTCEPMDPRPPAEPDRCPQWQAFAPLREVVRLTNVPGTDDLRRYPLQRRELLQRIPNSSSPAFDLYRHVCGVEPGFGAGCRDLARLAALAPSEEAWLLAVRWGLYSAPTPLPAEDRPSPCVEVQKSPQTAGGQARNMARQLVSELAAPLAPNPLGQGGCEPYHLTFGYRSVVELGSREPDVLRAAIRGRAVIYGADITAVNDVVASPVLGLLPGAHQHAMALDNLLTFGGAYWRDAPKLGILGLTAASLVEFGLAVLALAAGRYANWRIDRSALGCRARGGAALAFLFAAFFASLATAVALSLALNWAPVNWIGLFAVALIAKPNIIRGECLPNSRLRSRSEKAVADLSARR